MRLCGRIRALCSSACNSAWDTPATAQAIRAAGKKNWVVFGLEAHICVLQTVVDLAAAGFRVVRPAGCVASRRRLDHEIALRRAEREGAVPTTSEALMFELLREASSDTFRRLSALVKEW